jgi:hypothetical protein
MSQRAGEKLPPKLRLSKHTDMTIYWKALEEHLLIVQFSFLIQPFSGEKCIRTENYQVNDLVTEKAITDEWKMNLSEIFKWYFCKQLGYLLLLQRLCSVALLHLFSIVWVVTILLSK